MTTCQIFASEGSPDIQCVGITEGSERQAALQLQRGLCTLCVALTIEKNKRSELHATRVLLVDASHMSLCNLCCAFSFMICLPSFVVDALHVQDGLSQGTAKTQGKASLSGVG